MIELEQLVAPDRTALVTVEVQDGVVGEHSLLPELARAADPILAKIAALATSARAAGTPVVHCTVDSRSDGLGANRNTRFRRDGEARGQWPVGWRVARCHGA